MVYCKNMKGSFIDAFTSPSRWDGVRLSKVFSCRSSPSAPARYDPDMEESVPVLMCEVWLCEDAMDMTDCAKLLTGSDGDTKDKHVRLIIYRRNWKHLKYLTIRGRDGGRQRGTAARRMLDSTTRGQGEIIALRSNTTLNKTFLKTEKCFNTDSSDPCW